jgi:hypothetical protein
MDSRPVVGSRGRALGRLAPSGQVEILATAHPARTSGETIESGQDILVTGFDPFGLIVRDATRVEELSAPTPLRPWLSAPTESDSRPGRIGNLFLTVGAIICFLGCVFTVISTVFGLLATQRVSPLVPVTTMDTTAVTWLVLLDGFLEFCMFAALFVVFVRVSRLT